MKNKKFRCIIFGVLLSQSSHAGHGEGMGRAGFWGWWTGTGGLMAPSPGQSWCSLPRVRVEPTWGPWVVLEEEVEGGAVCAPCYLLEALLVPGLAVYAVGGNLPAVRDILADLRPATVPLTPLAVWLGRCGEAHLVLLEGTTQRGSPQNTIMI